MSEREFSVVNLLALLRHNADRFCRLSSRMGQMIAMLTYGGIPKPGDVVPDFHELEREMEALGLKSAAKHLDRTWKAFQTTGTPRTELLSLMNETYVRMLDDLEDQVFVAFPSENKELYEQSAPAFGQQVHDQFPGAARHEISEAAKCLALERYSASAFHSIRCLEAAIRAASRCLGIPDSTKVSERSWAKMLGAVKKAIDAKWPTSSDRLSGDGQFFDEAYAALAAMQNPWRNATMHLDYRYSEDEATDVFSTVSGFMKRISARMDERGLPHA